MAEPELALPRQWLVFKTADGAHVVPDNDAVPHDLDEDCVCGPRVEMVQRDCGCTGWLYVHHSLDGREASEQATA